MGLGVVLLCFGAAITGQHEVTMIGLAMIVRKSGRYQTGNPLARGARCLPQVELGLEIQP
jgi:hypothetical protein